MHNITGQIVERDDFYPRDADLARFIDRLKHDHILLSAPRRFGKSSFVNHLAGHLRQEGWHVVSLNAEKYESEFAFLDGFTSALEQLQVSPAGVARVRALLARRISQVSRTARESIRKVKLGGLLELELNANDADALAADPLDSLFRELDSQPRRVLIAIDEFPELLRAIRDSGPQGVQRLEAFLHWLRALRQSHARQIRWLLYGSIGLDGFLEQHKLSKLAHGLLPLELTPLSKTEALDFLQRLAETHRLPLDLPARQAILRTLGWPLPYFLQLMFESLRSLDATPITPAHVEQAFRNLLQPSRVMLYDHWRQRLEIQLEPEDRRLAHDTLVALSPAISGLTRAQLLSALMLRRPQANPDDLNERLGSLLLVLRRDGYVVDLPAKSGRKYAFRSFLLREYWKSRFHD